MRLIGEARLGGDGAEFVAGASDPQPGIPGAKFGAEEFWRNAVSLSEAARNGFGCQAVSFGPCRELERNIFAEVRGQEIGPIVLAIRCDGFLPAQRFAEQDRRVFDILFRSAGQRVGIIDEVQAGRAIRVMPIEPDDADAVRKHAIGVAIERWVNHNVAARGTYAADVSGLEKLAGESDRGVRSDVAMAREIEFIGHEFDAGSRLAEVRCGGQGREFNHSPIQDNVKWIQDAKYRMFDSLLRRT